MSFLVIDELQQVVESTDLFFVFIPLFCSTKRIPTSRNLNKEDEYSE